MALQRFCPKCGKKGIKGEFCKDCAPDILADFDIDNKMTICASCRKYQAGSWIKFRSLKDAVASFIKKQFKKRGTVGADMTIPDHTQNEGVKIEFDVDVTIGTEKYTVPFKIDYTLCPNCAKKGTQYFEGILQLRNPNSDAITFIRKEVKKENEKGVYINNEVKVRGGIDFFITSKRFLRKIPRLVQARFGGEIDLNAKLFSRNKQTSKDIHRVNALVKLPRFAVGDVLKVKNSVLLIKGLDKKAKGYDLIMGKNKSLEYKGLDFEILRRYATQVTKVRPQLEVLHPETFQSVAVRNRSRIQYKVSKKVDIVIDDGILII